MSAFKQILFHEPCQQLFTLSRCQVGQGDSRSRPRPNKLYGFLWASRRWSSICRNVLWELILSESALAFLAFLTFKHQKINDAIKSYTEKKVRNFFAGYWRGKFSSRLLQLRCHWCFSDRSLVRAQISSI